MQESVNPAVHNLTTPYSPVAVYYEGSDTVEYVRRDAPTVYRRIDEFLTLIFDMKARDELVGFQLKGFKNFYLQDEVRERVDFLTLVGLLERAITRFGDGVFDDSRKEAYDRARDLALEDGVKLHDLPRVA